MSAVRCTPTVAAFNGPRTSTWPTAAFAVRACPRSSVVVVAAAAPFQRMTAASASVTMFAVAPQAVLTTPASVPAGRARGVETSVVTSDSRRAVSWSRASAVG